MERIPLPARVIAKQQRLTTDTEGNITRDRMVIVQQKELVPIVAYDPVVREWATSQLAKDKVNEAVAQGVAQAVIYGGIIMLIGIPSFIYIGLVYF